MPDHAVTQTVTQDVIDAQAAELLAGVAEGDELDELQVAILRFALCASPAVLDRAGMARWSERSLERGATIEQLHEIVTLQAGVGVHAFFEGSRLLAARSRPDGNPPPLDPRRQALWDSRIGSRPYWTTMREELPGFLEDLLEMSPEAFEGFLDFAGMPFRSRLVPVLQMELIGMASDACRAHRYLPGMRMHLRNAVRMGAGRRIVLGCLAVAAESPVHRGIA